MRKLITLLALLCAAGCGNVAEEPGLRTTQQALCPPTNFAHGNNPAAFYAGSQGSYEHYVHVGTAYDHCNGSFPLVLAFHGGGQTALQFVQKPFMADVRAWADTVGAVVVWLDAEVDPANPTDNKWNAGHCCSTTVDHKQVVLELGQHLLNEFHVDPDRIHAIGFSNGGAFSQYIAAELPTTFASIATMAGWSGTFSRSPAQVLCWNPYNPACNFVSGYAWGSVPPPSSDTAVFMIRGSGDKVIPPNGVPFPLAQLFFGPTDILWTPALNNALMPGESDFELWSDATGCTATTTQIFAGVGENHVCQTNGKKVRQDIVFGMTGANGGNHGHYMPTLANTGGTYDGPQQVTQFLWNNPR